MRKNLIQCRKSQQLTQADVAREIGISMRQYQSMEAGQSDGRMANWYKLKTLFAVKSIDYLLEQEDCTTK